MGEQKESGEKGTVASKGKDTTPRTETRRALTFCVDDAFNRFNVFCTWCLLSVFFFRCRCCFAAEWSRSLSLWLDCFVFLFKPLLASESE